MRDVLIIGGGVMGCAAARELSRFALDVLVLEKTEDVCNGQSKANTAIVHAGYDALPGTLKARFNVLGNAMFDKLCGELDVPFERNGSLVVAFSKDGWPKLEELFARGIRNGVDGMSLIGHDEIMRLEPNINPEAAFALRAESAGIVCPYELTIAYAENAAKNGVKFLRNTAVTAIERADGFYRVKCGGESFEAKIVVNCAGVYSDEINNMVSSRKLHIAPRRGEYYIVDKNYSGAFRSSLFQLPTAMGKGVLIARTVDGTILVGPTAEDVDERGDTRTSAPGLAAALASAKRTWPGIPTRAFITNYAGVRAHLEGENDFVVGEAPDAQGFFNAAGLESPGLTSAPAIAAELAQRIAWRLGASPNAAFDPVRKGIPKFRSMSDDERAALIARDKAYARVICRCETVTEAEIREAIRRPVGAVTVDGVKRRTRAGMGRCQGGFCMPSVASILSEELHIPLTDVTKAGGGSKLLSHALFGGEKHD